MQYDQTRFNLKAVFSLPVLIQKKKNGYNTKNEIVNTIKNHVFQIGANINLRIFNAAKIQFLDVKLRFELSRRH